MSFESACLSWLDRFSSESTHLFRSACVWFRLPASGQSYASHSCFLLCFLLNPVVYIQGSRHSAESAEVKSRSSLIRLVIRIVCHPNQLVLFGWIDFPPNRLVCSDRLVSNSVSWPLVDHMLLLMVVPMLPNESSIGSWLHLPFDLLLSTRSPRTWLHR